MICLPEYLREESINGNPDDKKTKRKGIHMSKELINVAEIFGENVFNDTVMQERLPKKVYKNLKKTIEEGKELDLETADVIAH